MLNKGLLYEWKIKEWTLCNFPARWPWKSHWLLLILSFPMCKAKHVIFLFRKFTTQHPMGSPWMSVLPLILGSRGSGKISRESRKEGSLGRGHSLHRCSEAGVHPSTCSWTALWRSAAYLAGPPGDRCGAPPTDRLSCMAHSAWWPARSWAWPGLLLGLQRNTHC